MHSILEIVRRTTDFFRKAGVPNPRLDAELLIGHGLGLRREQLYIQFERPLQEPELEKIRALVKRRAGREPLQYIVGEVDFDDLRLAVDRRALIPRPETEELVDTVARLITPAKILDLGTGTGAIALAFLKRFETAEAVAADSSDEALALARENARRNELEARITFLRSDWYSEIPDTARFDLIVSNPPYLADEEWESAQPEVRDFEPGGALVAENGGLAALELLLAGAGRFLVTNGLIALETGIDQHRSLEEKAREAGFGKIESRKDMSGRDRFLLAWR